MPVGLGSVKDLADALRDLSDRIKNQDLVEDGLNALHEEVDQLQQTVSLIQQAAIEHQEGLRRFGRRLEAVEARPVDASMPQLNRGDTVVGISVELLRWVHDVCEQHFEVCEDDIGHRDLGMLSLLKQRLN